MEKQGNLEKKEALEAIFWIGRSWGNGKECQSRTLVQDRADARHPKTEGKKV
jgi:hypothetical protein